MESSVSSHEIVREERKKSSLSFEEWSIPVLAIALFFVALAVAAGHFVYCQQLDKKLVSSTIPQSWNNVISTGFAYLFSWSLAGSATISFTQLLWWHLHRKPLTIATISALFELTTSPAKLGYLNILFATPILWFFALLFPLIPVATFFPPGALVVEPLPQTNQTIMPIPTLDVDFRGNGSAIDFFKYAMFTTGFDGEYRLALPRLTGVAKQTILDGTYLTRPSPCQANCTYSITFVGPSLQCGEGGDPNLADIAFRLFQNTSTTEGTYAEWSVAGANYLSAPYKSNNTILGQSSDQSFVLDLQYKDQATDTMRNISCVAFSATYKANVTYLNNIQSVKLDVTRGNPLNASVLGRSMLFYDVGKTEGAPYASVKPGNQSWSLSEDELNDAYQGSQLRAIRDGMAFALSGAISEFGSENAMISHTIIHESPMVSSTNYSDSALRYTNLEFKITPAILEELMQNVTISLFNRATSTSETEVEMTLYDQSYVFEYPLRLLVPYVASLVVALVFIVVGLAAMVKGGIYASSGIFLQILCTTSNGGAELSQKAAKAYVEGDKQALDELMRMKIRFGEVRDQASPEYVRLAAFGTVDDTMPLRKGTTMRLG